MDEVRPIEEKVHEELREELAVLPDKISSITYGPIIKKVDFEIGRTWLIQSVCVVLSEQPDIVLDWEHTDFAWVSPSEVERYDIIPGVESLVEYFYEHI